MVNFIHKFYNSYSKLVYAHWMGLCSVFADTCILCFKLALGKEINNEVN